MRQGLAEAEAARKAEADTAAESAGELAAEAIRTRRGNCLPGDATAYEDSRSGKKSACFAKEALSHAQFGFGTVERGDPPAHQRQRYYSILWPLPRLTPAGQKADPAVPEVRPLVDVMVLDSNTLDVDGGVLGPPQAGREREDQLQLLVAPERDVAMGARARRQEPGLEDRGDAPPRRSRLARARARSSASASAATATSRACKSSCKRRSRTWSRPT